MNLSYKKAIAFGFSTYMKNLKYFLSMILILIGIVGIALLNSTVVLSNASYIFKHKLPILSIEGAVYYGILFIGLGIVALAVLSASLFMMWITMGIIKIGVKNYEHILIRNWRDVFVFDIKNIIKFSIASILWALLIILGLALLIAPGIYFFIRYFFARYSIADQNKGILESFKESSRLTQSFKWRFLFVTILIILILILLNISINMFIFSILAEVSSFFAVSDYVLGICVILLIPVYYFYRFSTYVVATLVFTYIYKKLESYQDALKTNSSHSNDSIMRVKDLEDINNG